MLALSGCLVVWLASSEAQRRDRKSPSTRGMADLHLLRMHPTQLLLAWTALSVLGVHRMYARWVRDPVDYTVGFI